MHIGFVQNDQATFDAIRDCLTAYGWDTPVPRDTHGAWTFDTKVEGGSFVEVGIG